MEHYQYYSYNLVNKGLAGAVEIKAQDITNALNHYASEGWEYINAVTTVMPNGCRVAMTLFFRRRIA